LGEYKTPPARPTIAINASDNENAAAAPPCQHLTKRGSRHSPIVGFPLLTVALVITGVIGYATT
jgi:hypothetical protein